MKRKPLNLLITWMDKQIEAYDQQIKRRASAGPLGTTVPATSLLSSWYLLREQLQLLDAVSTSVPESRLLEIYQVPLRSLGVTTAPGAAEVEIAKNFQRYLKATQGAMAALGLPGDPTTPPFEDD